jgi:hypothetical protein
MQEQLAQTLCPRSLLCSFGTLKFEIRQIFKNKLNSWHTENTLRLCYKNKLDKYCLEKCFCPRSLLCSFETLKFEIRLIFKKTIHGTLKTHCACVIRTN